jgi:dipeptidyl aminopeptidase/acylaminoacyl peptidase
VSIHTRIRAGHRPVRRSVAIIALMAVLACGRDSEPTIPGVDPPVALTVAPSVLRLMVGGSANVSAKAVDARNRVVSVSFLWSSADPTIASVGERDGAVVAISPGSTTVTATAGTLTATATVLVRPPDPPVAISISRSSVSLLIGGIERLVAHATDSGGRATNTPFEWSSADPSVATVGRVDGVVTGIATGMTRVTVTTGTVSASATVSVVEFSGSFAFTRERLPGAGPLSSDVLLYSGSAALLQSLPRPLEFGSVASPAWSPDGTTLVVEGIHAFFGPPEYEWVERASDLYVLDASAPMLPWRALTTNGLSTSPSWSPDGNHIAYLEQDQLFATNRVSIIDASGGAPRRLTLTEGYYGRPRWSPDGKRLAFSETAVGTGSSRIVVVNVDGSISTAFTSVGVSYDPSWSPDGTQLVFTRSRNGSASAPSFELVVSDVTGSNVRVVVSLPEYATEPTWSPDGGRILFSSSGGLRVVNIDGSRLTRVTSTPEGSWDRAPAWIP